MPEHIGHAELVLAWNNLASSLGLDPEAGIEILVAVPRDVTLKLAGRLEPAWGGAWQWNLSDGLAKAAIISVLIAATLASAGVPIDMAPIVVPAVMPLLFDVKRVRLERTEDNYLRIIGIRPEITDRLGYIPDLYNSLPDQVKHDISRVQFESLLFKAVEAGRVVSYGEVFEVLPNGETAFKIFLK